MTIKKLKERLAGLGDYGVESRLRKIKSPLKDKVPFGKENRTPKKIRDDSLDRATAEGLASFENASKILPPKPKQSDRRRIISAKQKLSELKNKLDEKKLTKEHLHSIVFTGSKLGQFKAASLETQSGKYAKYWLLNAKQTNGNGWGISQSTIKENIKKFIGRPLVVTAQSWHDGVSEYGESYEHPYLPTNDMNQIFEHQNKFKVGRIVDVFEDRNNDWFASIEMLPKYAMKNLPPFCSPAIYQLDAREREGNISKWEALHLAALTENPAYGARIALLKGTCIGTVNSCTIQFRGAKQLEAGRFDPQTPNEYGDTQEQSRARELITIVQNNRKLQKHMNSPEGRKANKLYVEKGEKINPKEHLDKLRRRMAGLNKNPSKKIFPEQTEEDDEDRYDEIKEEKERRFKRDVDIHVLRSKLSSFNEAQIICPKKLKERLASLGEQNMTYQNSKRIKILKKKFPEVRKAQSNVEDILRGKGRSVDGSHSQESFLSSTGDYIGGGGSHSRQIDEINKTHTLAENRDSVIHDFITKHKIPRVQTFRINKAGDRHTSFHINSKINKDQLKSIQELEKGGREIGFSVGEGVGHTTGNGSTNLIKALRENKFL